VPWALITGASSGLGEEFAYALARERFSLVLTARREQRLAAVAERARALGALATEVIAQDLSRRDGPAALFERLERAGIGVDFLVNNAGFGTRGSFAQLPLQRELEQVDLNIGAVVAVARLAVAGMVERGYGTIINVASTSAFQPMPYMAVYGASKAFVLSFSLALAAEVGERGVHVMALCPGLTRTEFQQVADTAQIWLPGLSYMTAKAVVDQALAAVRRRKRLYINGRMNRLAAGMVRFAPRVLVSRIVAAIYRPSQT
jgi:short-subunit dehydrogenase